MPDVTLITINHKATDTVLAEGPRGWGVTPFEGNYYVQGKFLNEELFHNSAFPGVCFYKGIYHWVNVRLPNGDEEGLMAWRYVVPNPLLPFIAFRVGIQGKHPALSYTSLPSVT